MGVPDPPPPPASSLRYWRPATKDSGHFARAPRRHFKGRRLGCPGAGRFAVATESVRGCGVDEVMFEDPGWRPRDGQRTGTPAGGPCPTKLRINFSARVAPLGGGGVSRGTIEAPALVRGRVWLGSGRSRPRRGLGGAKGEAGLVGIGRRPGWVVLCPSRGRLPVHTAATASTPPRNARSVATANRPAPDPPQPPASSLRWLTPAVECRVRVRVRDRERAPRPAARAHPLRLGAAARKIRLRKSRTAFRKTAPIQAIVASDVNPHSHTQTPE